METAVHSTRKYEYLRHLSDEVLVKMVEEPLAAEILLKRYAGMVRSLAGKYFLQGADREDLVQEGQIGLLEAIRGYSGGKRCSFRSFACLCVKRQIITAVKAYSRQKNAPLNTSLPLRSGAGDSGEQELLPEIEDMSFPSVEEQMISRELMLGLYRFMNTACSELEKKVFLMLLDGRTYQEIAAACHRSVKSVDGTLQRVRRKLAQHFSRELGLG